MEPNYANLVIKIIKLFNYCSIFVVVMGIILIIMGNFFEHCPKA